MAKVLIADDSTFVRHVMRTMLEDAGHEVVAEAGTGEETITRCAETRPDVAVIDINMPTMDGVQAAEVLREFSADIGLVLASVYATDTRRRDAAELGAVFIEKPYTADVLRAAVTLAARIAPA